MELLLLRAYASGYRGCAIDEESYFFFQSRRNGKIKRLMGYSKADFEDLQHFTAMMQKFVSPPAFLQPPIPISSLTLAELDRVHAEITP